jgi:hypothetical protein
MDGKIGQIFFKRLKTNGKKLKTNPKIEVSGNVFGAICPAFFFSWYP